MSAGTDLVIQTERKQAQMRKFRTAVVAGVAVALFALSACAGQASKDKEEADKKKEEVGDYVMEQDKDVPEGLLADAVKDGKLVVGVKPDQPLIGEKKGSTYEGFDIEMAKLLGMRLFGKGGEEKVEFKETTSDNREAFLNSGEVDVVIASYSMYPDRVKQFSFAGPYLFTGQNALVSAENKDIKTIDDLAGKKVCIAKGSGSIDNLKKENPKAKIETRANYGDCAAQVKDGTFDAVSTDETILYGYKSQDKEAFRILDSSENFTDEPYGIGMKKGNDAAKDYINEMIKAAYENEDWDKAFELTFGAAGMEKPEYPEIGKITSD
ncbi:extracellular solute-binding protein family 3 [Stackebrandtia nassauensis DSM 44728]|uniref:Extracellular solute-binding protein family 3 n=2 Tax=Stackebrandtia TaxID=283810 RepID=D3PZU9_STANL|nr:extracellular solute-binding protein family 3 [Stackebrandtia nassauensis DSM 44728]